MQRLERFFDGATINDLLLLGDAPERRLRPIEDDFWPPRPTQDYWLPQRLRDFIIDRFGEDRLQLNAWLFSLVERFAETPEAFDQSPECRRLIERASLLAGTPLNGRPKASIVIPVYNNLLYTLTCLVSVLESAPSHSFEILIGDDGSTDGTAEAIAEIGGLVRHVRHPKNLGFLGNCNAVARRATGEHLVLLNNDTIVFPGWLDALVETLDENPQIGFVGSKLLNGDGSLQEAGGVFWRDGSAWNFGRDGDPQAPEFNYLKDVDYVSGASIAVPARLWKALDGFDTTYSPAYCEDSDLAFRVREAGYRTVYHPHSILVHHEGRSHGRDVSSGVKAYQVVNQRKFLERWGPTLAEQNFDNAQNVFLARDRSRGRPHILVVDHYVPQWDQDAGSRTMFHFIRAFVNRGFHVTLWPDNLNEDRDYVAPLQRMGVEVIYGPRFVGGFEAWMAENGAYLDYALLSRPHISESYIDVVTRAGVKTFYYGHDLHCLRARSTYQVTGDRNDLVEAEKWEVRELSVSLKSDVVMYPGIEEIDYMSRLLPASARLIRPPITIFDADELNAAENAIDADSADPYALMFVGGFSHTPNGDGIVWFLDRIWPRLRAADERFSLRIAGSRMPDDLRDRADPGVEYLGRVSDEELSAIYEGSGVAIVPLRYGGGIKGKVIEAFARGVPVVMTDVGAQGIPDAHRLGFVAGADDGFADAVVAAVTDRAEARERARRAVDFLRSAYSEQAFCDLLAPEAPELGGSTA
ncbi:glycosyltransferase [Brevundimonas sp. VNH65]|uniref:glycosyltransferase n=1 Tax=Brevundimonas sp. VNH65 TaxID=3400917 RepID=UPI003C1187C0